ncbi:hypothetical protein BGW36DRAFT_54062 [Talaromyces proteolyticus]|uniref:Zn(2)-C6 fungal-type domain-containing protein n=1 Tax=Talaromyces proteolyticus TaxID=1131652 RepID=A0AAD4KMS2_9EURO|nr:uncharacterized protein BGW36DRAFT_54062 [Talaromyces proteolyticus]KAH8691530.1 hypothetical protein BGW36DRAFT_54062 [Talaromyces proteolyticus]
MNLTPASTSTALHACAPCRSAKRRCDKALPSCGLCQRTRRNCDYAQQPASEESLRARIRELESALHLSSESPSTLTDLSDETVANSSLRTSIFFLDSDIHEYSNIPIKATTGVSIPEYVGEHLQERCQIDEITTLYFESVHTWMPIINKTRLSQLVDTAQTQNEMQADLALLLLTMKLIQHPPDAYPAQSTSLYVAAKRFSFALDMAGICSLLRLQATLLITVYELGHAVFPAAYLSIGSCARLGFAMGIHHKSAPQMLRKPRNWMDWDERQRVWWLVIILDRYISAGGDYRPLNSDEPSTQSYISGDDGAWDRGEMVVAPERLRTSTDHPVSQFSRMAQAAHLLGQAIRHCNDETSNMSFVLEDIDVVCQATNSLLNLMTANRDDTVCYYVAVAICFSALMKVSEFHSCDSFAKEKPLDAGAFALARQCTAKAVLIMKQTAAQIISFVQVLNESLLLEERNLPTLSPLFFHCVYRAAAALTWVSSETSGAEREQYIHGISLCVEILQRAEARWKSADAYLEALRIMAQYFQDG